MFLYLFRQPVALLGCQHAVKVHRVIQDHGNNVLHVGSLLGNQLFETRPVQLFGPDQCGQFQAAFLALRCQVFPPFHEIRGDGIEFFLLGRIQVQLVRDVLFDPGNPLLGRCAVVTGKPPGVWSAGLGGDLYTPLCRSDLYTPHV